MNTTQSLQLNNSSHVVALVTPTLLNPNHPEQSHIFERAALIQQTTGCDVTVLHATEKLTARRNMEESIAFKVLVQRVNNHFDVDFDSHLAFSGRNLSGIGLAFEKINGHVMLKQNPGEPGDRMDTTGIDLLESAAFPVWFVNSHSSINEISARLNDDFDVRDDDSLTCHVARDLGVRFDSEVQIRQSTPQERNTQGLGDLVVTCVPTPDNCADDDILESLRREAVLMLKAPVEFDLLIHRGREVVEVSQAA